MLLERVQVLVQFVQLLKAHKAPDVMLVFAVSTGIKEAGLRQILGRARAILERPVLKRLKSVGFAEDLLERYVFHFVSR